MKFLFFFFALAFSVAACENSLEELDRVRALNDAGVERAEKVVLLYSDSAQVRVRIIAPLMLNYLDPKNPRREFPKGIDADFFDNHQRPISKLTSKFAQQTEQNQQVVLRDSVVVWNQKGERLETEELIWMEKDNKVQSTKFVKITTPTRVIYGYGFRSNTEFTDWEIDSVSGTVQSNSFLDSPLN